MKNFKKIKLSNIDNSKIEKEQLRKLSGRGNPLNSCQNCTDNNLRANSYVSRNTDQGTYEEPDYYKYPDDDFIPFK